MNRQQEKNPKGRGGLAFLFQNCHDRPGYLGGRPMAFCKPIWGGEHPMKIHYKVWLEKDDRVLFGEGRRDLLRAIEENGSLAQAAKKMNMSYRAAWGRLKASEDRLGFPLAEKDSEQGKKGGLHLTPKGKALLEQYTAIHKALDTLVDKLERKYF
jgi:molybdate transport system regulatory protein